MRSEKSDSVSALEKRRAKGKEEPIQTGRFSGSFYIYDCADTTKAPIDFGRYVLIITYTSLDENDKKSLTVIQNNIQQRLLYKMTVTRVPGPTGGGFGNFYSSGMNWVKVAKPPAGYAILIDFTEN